MPKIRDDVVRAVLDRAKIEDVVDDILGSYSRANPGGLKKCGVNYTAICPFHDDHNNGNFIVRPSTIAEKNGGNTYKCFVCDKKGGPVQFLMDAERMTFPDAIRWLGKKYCVEVDDVPVNWTPPPPPTLLIPRSWVQRTMELAGDNTLFIYWLRHLPWNQTQQQRLDRTLWQYCVGGWRDGRVVFWQIDHDGNPRAAKLMRYLQDGHRDKTQHPGWIYNQNGCREQLKPDEHTIEKPLFGIHLLKRYPNAIVNIVESEKTAIIMANFYGDPDRQLWLACGGLKHLRLEAMQPLIDQERTVWLWPDKDGVGEWQKVVDKLGSDNVHIYTQFLDTCWREEDGEKADCADITIRMMRTGDQPRKPEPKADEVVKVAGVECIPWPTDEPFIDYEEVIDPRVRQWREQIGHKYISPKTKKQ